MPFTALDSEAAAPASWRTRRRRTALVTAAIAGAAGLATAGAGGALAQGVPASAAWLTAVGGLGALALLALAPRMALPLRPAAALGAALLGLALAGGYGLASGTPPAPVGHDPNAAMVARVKQVAEALREERTIAGGKTPRRGELLPYLRALPDAGPLLANPFGGPEQTTTRLLPATDSPLPGAAALAAGAEPPPVGLRLGRGEPALAGKPYTLRTWGAMAFDHDPASGETVLYGIGRDGDQAVLVHVSRGGR